MKKYNVEVVWKTGFTHTYEIMGGPQGSRGDAVKSAVEHLENIRNLLRYTITNEDGHVVKQFSREEV